MESARENLVIARIRDCFGLLQQLSDDRNYLESVTKSAEAIVIALRAGNKILFFGNGGSAADAQHLAAEFTGRFLKERPSLAGLALTTNTSALTAVGNDYSFEEVFSRQVSGLGNEGDVAFGITTSGSSPNVLRALKAAREKQLVTVGLTGKNDAQLRPLVDHCISIPSAYTPRIQEAHILTGHIICELMEQQMAH